MRRVVARFVKYWGRLFSLSGEGGKLVSYLVSVLRGMMCYAIGVDYGWVSFSGDEIDRY